MKQPHSLFCELSVFREAAPLISNQPLSFGFSSVLLFSRVRVQIKPVASAICKCVVLSNTKSRSPN